MTKPKYPIKDLKKWVAALRSGKYSQTKETLQNENGYCCLGVACKLFILKGDKFVNLKGHLTGVLPDNQPYSPQWLIDISNVNIEARTNDGIMVHCPLSDWNDRGKSFKEIADLIEKHFIKGAK